MEMPGGGKDRMRDRMKQGIKNWRVYIYFFQGYWNK